MLVTQGSFEPQVIDEKVKLVNLIENMFNDFMNNDSAHEQVKIKLNIWMNEHNIADFVIDNSINTALIDDEELSNFVRYMFHNFYDIDLESKVLSFKEISLEPTANTYENTTSFEVYSVFNRVTKKYCYLKFEEFMDSWGMRNYLNIELVKPEPINCYTFKSIQ